MTDWDREMQKALEADGEKLRQLTGEDHGPWFVDDEPHPGLAPCPHCFESSGFAARSVPHTYWEPGYDEVDPTMPCPYCHGSGSVECEPRTLDDIANEDAEARPA